MIKSYIFSLVFIFGFLPLQGQEFSVFLSGDQQPLPVQSTASGSVSATLTGDTLRLEGAFGTIVSGVDTSIAGGAHIHEAIAGRNGGVSYVLQPTLSDGLNEGSFEVASNTFILDEAAKDALWDRKLYLNVHSARHRSGEIRGQLLPSADEVYSAHLFGSNQTISVMSNASGMVLLERRGDTVVASGSFQLSSPLATNIAGGIHIHSGMAGINGGIIQALNVVLSEDSLSAEILPGDNTFPMSAEDLALLEQEGWYVNVHSRNWPSGELRGQLTPLATAKMRAHLSGANQTPPVTTFAGGKLALALRDGNLTVSGSFSGLDSEVNTDIAGGAHIHLGMAGRNGGLLLPLALTLGDDSRSATLDPLSNTFPVSGDTLMALLNRALYVNVHTLAHGGGAIRGQILPESNYFLQAYLSGSQQPDPVLTNADGAVIMEVLGDSLTVSGTFGNLSSDLAVNIAMGAHVHFAPVGTNGGLAYPLTPTPDGDAMNGHWRADDNRFGANFTRRDSLRARLGYVNVHTGSFNGGEIRGQLMHEARAYFYTPLSGAEQTPAVVSAGTGAAMMEYNGNAAIFVGSFRNLGSGLATSIRGGSHLHFAMPGGGGPILTDLVVSQGEMDNAGVYRAMNNIYPVSQGWMDTVRQRMTYINIHSIDIPSGELRGQMRPLARNYHLANLRGKNAANPAPSTGMGAMLFEQNGTQFTAYGSFNNLVGDFATDIAGGAHVHEGTVGASGGILLPLNSEVSEDLKSAVFLADSNSVVVPDSVMMSLINSGAYVNIHSTTVPPGEIRGQIHHVVNHAPDATSFTEPGSGDTIIIEGDLNMEFAARWEAVTDPDGHEIVYLWQLSASPDFSAPALTVSTGDATEFVTTIGVVDTLLSTLGIDSGEVITIYHRVAASDGSLCAVPTMDSVVLVKGTPTSLEENPYLENAFILFPNPAFDRIQLDVELKQGAMGELQILDLQGRTIYRQPTQLVQGHNLIQHQVGNLGTGTYIARLIVNQEVSVAKTFIKK